MKRSYWVWLALAAVSVIVVAYHWGQSGYLSTDSATADPRPSIAAGADPLASVAVIPARVHSADYDRVADFGDAWTDNNSSPSGHNGCDTRNDILTRDLTDVTYTKTSACPKAIKTGVLHDPYTGEVINFKRGDSTSDAVQIDHIVPLALAWDLGARTWPQDKRVQFANDPANLLAVDGPSNQAKSDKEPGRWMPKADGFRCQYALQFSEVLRGYGLPIDQASAGVLRQAAGTCPKH